MARNACQTLTTVPSTRASDTSAAVVNRVRLRLASLRRRYQADGGLASTGSSFR